MSNKVTNIYIDTTGFCDDAMVRVNNALDTIVEHNDVENFCPSAVEQCRGQNVVYFNRNGAWYYAGACSPLLDGKTPVGLWQLESIAFRCKQEKKEELLPTRNIYINALKLTQDGRRKAFKAISELSIGRVNGWLPHSLAHSGNDVDYILFDIFSINNFGERQFYSGSSAKHVIECVNGLVELTYDQLMSLTN